MSVSEGKKKKNEDGLEVVLEGRVGDEGKEASGLGNSFFFFLQQQSTWILPKSMKRTDQKCSN